jgi:hypothetical protein
MFRGRGVSFRRIACSQQASAGDAGDEASDKRAHSIFCLFTERPKEEPKSSDINHLTRAVHPTKYPFLRSSDLLSITHN